MELRGYFFGNMYLSSIQQGIQAAHTVADMFVNYVDFGPEHAILHDWGNYHKTMVLLNAGYSEEIRYLARFFDTSSNQYPWAVFTEGEDALDGATTCVGIVLPETIFNASKLVREGVIEANDILTTGKVTYIDENEDLISYNVTEWEYKLIMRLNNYGLAR